MKPFSIISDKNAIKNRSKIHRNRQEIACKTVAFQQLTSLKQNQMSERQAAALLGIPLSTMRSWDAQKNYQKIAPEITDFFSTPVGQKFLNRLVSAANMAIRYGHGGIRGLQEFLHLSDLNNFVASSEGALHAFIVRSEEQMLRFGSNQEMLLGQSVKQRKITVGLDEMYRGRRPCLVAMEIVSGYILLEKFTEDRTAATWVKELKPKLERLDVQVDQVVSDLCGGIRACAKLLGATHSPDIFHAQQEITKATSAPLASQEETFKSALDDAEKKLQKSIKKHGENSEKSKQARAVRNLRRMGYEERKERRNKVRAAKKELSRTDHPISLKTGKLQTTENIKDTFHKQLAIIEESANEASLPRSCMKRLAKAGRAFDAIWEYMVYFLAFFSAYVRDLKLLPDQEMFFRDVVFPLSYFHMIWRRLPKKEREELQPLIEQLKKKFEEGGYSEEKKSKWMVNGRECAEKFQRSTSCVEGRNGVLSLYHHRFCRMNQRSCQALTVIHNFHLRRSDGKTAAERFFGYEHSNLFEFLIANVYIPGKPKKHTLAKQKSGSIKQQAMKFALDRAILAA